MCMETQGGTYALVHAVVLLAVSFFVLLATIKNDSKALKTFGYAIAVLLWLSAALVFGKSMASRHCGMGKMHMMGGKECGSMMGKEMMGHKMENLAPAK
ncbi:MAG: hypothetical protein Q7K98_08155 [Candidatus Omnitrophota bacterium]|nr:hypothetical protein [Candidatus Omnitrophota bacterium]